MPLVYLGDAFGLVWRTIVLTLCAKSKGIGSEKQRLTCKLIRWFRCSKEKKSGTARTISAFLRRDVSKGDFPCSTR
jgi:hypothetical protein